MGRPKVLLVGTNPALYEPLIAALRERQAYSVLADQADQAATAAKDEDISLIVLMGSQEFCQSFFQVFADLQPRQASAPLLVVASQSSEAFAVASLRAGAREYLAEPIEPALLLQSIARWVPECGDAPDNTELTGGEVLVGRSAAMQALRAQIRRVAVTDCNVLITGETGTGKELVAQLIHQNSPRSKHPMVSINCAAIPDSLLESELFGYERGAFTGASCANHGKLMAANRGTVFFDEVGDMSPLAQAKVLRAIETREVMALGSTRTRETDIRIVAATHHNLDDLTTPETFRRDLYFRLNVGRIHLPPLRDRKADIACLVDRVIFDLNRKLGRRIEGVHCAALRQMTQYDWPGNVRELKNVMERVFIARDAGLIDQQDLSPILSPRLPQLGQRPVPNEDLRCLKETLASCNGNKSKAAERLSWSRMTLYRKLAKYGLD